MTNKGYYYAIIDGEEKIIEKPNGKFNFEREYQLLGRVPSFVESQLLNSKCKIRRCCANCANFVKWSDVFGDEIEYWCDLDWDKMHEPGYDSSDYDSGWDENKCKYFEINAEKLRDAFECDEVE